MEKSNIAPQPWKTTKIHRFHLWLFIFNPFGVDFTITITTGCTCGYSYSTPLGL